MGKKTSAKKVAKTTSNYTATAKVMGKNFVGVGATAHEAIKNIDAGNVAGTVILTVSKGDVSKDRIIPMVKAKRLFMTMGMTREIALRQVSSLFDGI